VKILHLSTTDREGGAALAANRLHRGLLGCQVDSRMLVQSKLGSDPTVTGSETALGRLAARVRYQLDSLPALISRRRRGTTFTPALLPDRLAGQIAGIAPDLVHLHWVAGGFLRLENLARFNRPLVWTLHDMWPFTGGCHYCGACRGYTGSCGFCPELDSSRESDLSRRIWRRKARAWRDLPLTIVAPSRWMAQCARESSLFAGARITVLPNGIDTSLFQPGDRRAAREILGLPQDRRLVLFGAMSPTAEPRKGFGHLRAALGELGAQGWGDRTELVVYGASDARHRPDFGLPTRYVGHVSDQARMALLNVAADLVVAPSAQDNLPNTVLEALSCGTPVVAFSIGGMPDLIEHGVTGWLCQPLDHQDLARGIAQVIGDPALRQTLGQQARAKVEREFSESLVARRHLELYEKLLGSCGC